MATFTFKDCPPHLSETELLIKFEILKNNELVEIWGIYQIKTVQCIHFHLNLNFLKELVSKRSLNFEQSSEPDKHSVDAPLSATEAPPSSPAKQPPSQTNSMSPAKRKEELHEKLARLNSRYVSQGEKQEKPQQDSNTSKVGLAAIQDIAAKQEAALKSEDVTPTNDLNFLRYDPTSNRMTLELDPAGSSGDKDQSQR